jgi:hypothetical protein
MRFSLMPSHGSPINYVMTSTIGFLQNPRFFCYYPVPKYISYRPDIENQVTVNLQIPRDGDFDKVKIKAANENTVCEAGSTSTVRMSEPTLQNVANNINKGKPSA